MGVPCWKSAADMWNYQQILFELKPSLVIEFETARSGSALFYLEISPGCGCSRDVSG